MSNAHLYTILLSILVSCSTYASDDDKQSFIASMLNSQFPFNAFNTPEKQREFGNYVLDNTVPDALESGPEYKKISFCVVAACIEKNGNQVLLNSRANAGLLGAIPFVLYPKTRKFGLGMCSVAGGLKLDAARRLPHIDVTYVAEVFEEIEKILPEQTLNRRPLGSSDNTNDSI